MEEIIAIVKVNIGDKGKTVKRQRRKATDLRYCI